MGGIVNSVVGVAKDVKNSVGDIGEGIVKGAGAVVRGGTDIVAGRSLDDSKSRLGGAVNKGISGYMGTATGGLTRNNMVNAYTGGSLTKLNSGYEAFGNLISGKSVSKNIKDQASLLLQAGQAYVGQTGVNLGGMDMTDFVGDIMGGLDARLSGQGKTSTSTGYYPNPINYVSPSQASYNGAIASNATSFLPYILIGGIVIIGAVLLLKKKK